MTEFRDWWENSDEAHKARHDGEEACARAAWAAALELAGERTESHGANAQEVIAHLLKGL